MIETFEQAQQKLRDEEAYWASLAGPVTVRYIEKEENNGSE